MKTSFFHPLLVSLAAAPLWGGLAHGQDNNNPPKPADGSRAELHVFKTDKDDADDDDEENAKYKPYEHGYNQGKKQKVTFLGVNTAPLPEAVAAQLPVEKGTGLLVSYVAKDSPAAKAGLEANDVLLKLDEHVLVNSAQLQTLIENRKDGEAATLTYYRQGQPKTASATLATQEKSFGRRGWTSFSDWSDPARTAEFQATMAKAQADVQRALADARRAAADSARGEIDRQKGELAAEMANLRRTLKGIDLPSREMFTSFNRPGTAQTITMDDDGMFLLTRRDGRVLLRATDRGGKVLFEGDVTKPEDQAKAPSSVTKKLQKLLRDLPTESEASIPPVPPAPPAPAAPAAPVGLAVPGVPAIPGLPANPATPAVQGVPTIPVVPVPSATPGT